LSDTSRASSRIAVAFAAVAGLRQQGDDLVGDLGVAAVMFDQRHRQIQRGGDAVVQIDPAEQRDGPVAFGRIGGQAELQDGEKFQRLVRRFDPR
jgi:hypothetical protein